MIRWIIAVVCAGLLILLIVHVKSQSTGAKPGTEGSETATTASTSSSAGEITTETGIEIVRIPEGWFEMGSEKGGGDEQPVHKVWVGAFYMDKYEVTQEAYEALIGENPSEHKGKGNPVERLTWDGAAAYCNERSRREGLEPCYDEETWECNFGADGYRLSTEAEWEYACRAGTKANYSFGSAEQKLARHGWFTKNSDNKPHPVGKKLPNPWGLHDMHGNVWEWINDYYGPEYYEESPDRNPIGPEDGWRSMRGGSFQDSADSCRSSYRKYNDDDEQLVVCAAYGNIGFRCVRRVPKEKE